MFPAPRYPFGLPILPRPPSADSPREYMILGAYPSALHVHWTPPAPYRPVQALAVADEPTPFWEGEDQDRRVEEWKDVVGFNREWGEVGAAPRFNGPSGRKLLEMVMEPLGIDRENAWITDCLDLYHASVGNLERVRDTYQPFVESRVALGASLPDAHLLPHPDEDRIVRLAVEHHMPRLQQEVERCSPRMLLTLGNAALRVAQALVDEPETLPGKLRADSEYGQLHEVQIAGRPAQVLPLAHPAAPRSYQIAHQKWIESLRTK